MLAKESGRGCIRVGPVSYFRMGQFNLAFNDVTLSISLQAFMVVGWVAVVVGRIIVIVAAVVRTLWRSGYVEGFTVW